MKSRILPVVFILSLLCISEIYAQQKLGVRAGYNNTFFRTHDPNNDLYELHSKNGFNLGMVWEIPFSDKTSFETGLAFENKGVNYDPFGSGFLFNKPDGYLRYSLLYLNLPVTLRFCWGERTVKPTFAVGPYVSYLLNARYKFTKDLTQLAESEYGDSEGVLEVGFVENDDSFIPFDVGLNLAAGVSIDKFRIELGYDRGYLNIQTTYVKDEFVKNEVYKITMSYMFGLY